MKAYYDILDEFKDIFDADISINTVTQGSLDDVALQKTTLYGLVHVMITDVVHNGPTLDFNVSLLVMDIVDESKTATTDIFKGNDNEVDVLNTTLAVLVRGVEQFRRGSSSELYQLVGSPTYNAFTKRFEDSVAGWTGSLTIRYKHDMTIC